MRIVGAVCARHWCTGAPRPANLVGFSGATVIMAHVPAGSHLLVKMLKAENLMPMEHGTATPYLKVCCSRRGLHVMRGTLNAWKLLWCFLAVPGIVGFGAQVQDRQDPPLVGA